MSLFNTLCCSAFWEVAVERVSVLICLFHSVHDVLLRLKESHKLGQLQGRRSTFIKQGIMGLVRCSHYRPLEESQGESFCAPRSHQRVFDGLHVATGRAAALIKSILSLPAEVCFAKHQGKEKFYISKEGAHQ